MLDFLYCPICFNQLKSSKPQITSILFNHDSLTNKKTSHYIKRSCLNSPHQLTLYADKMSGKIDFIRFCPFNDYSTFIDIFTFLNKSVLSIYKNSDIVKKIIIEESLIVDFPKMEKLKEKLETLISFS